jgi:hypothetical protein
MGTDPCSDLRYAPIEWKCHPAKKRSRSAGSRRSKCCPVDRNSREPTVTIQPKALLLLDGIPLLQEPRRPRFRPESGSDESIEADELRSRFAELLLKEKNPGFMTVYLTALDHIEHETSPFSKESLALLERLDAVVGGLRQEAEARGSAVICIVSDHGFAKTDKELNLNAALRQAGLIQLNPDGFGEVMARFGLAGRRFCGDHVEGTRGR